MPGAGALTLHPFGPVARGAWGAGGGGPANPQALNRYAYALNNPLRNSDPTGHCVLGIVVDTMVCAALGAAVVGMVAYAAVESARQLAEQYPVDACQYMTCLPAENRQDAQPLPVQEQGSTVQEAKQSKRSGRERGTDIPSWAKGQKARPGEQPSETAKRLLDEQYGVGNWSNTGPESEYNKIKKHHERTRDEQRDNRNKK